MADPIITIDAQPVSQFVRIGQTATFNVLAHQDQAATLNYQWNHNGVAIVGATSASYSFTVTPDGAGLYTVLITCSIGANTALSAPVALASSIFDNIELQIAIAILGMTIAGGYNFNWQTINELQQGYGGYPRAAILSPKETCKDSPNAQNSQAYSNDVLFIIDSMCEQTGATQNPDFTIRSLLRLALDDLKSLMGFQCSIRGGCLNNSCDKILYRGSDIITTGKNNVQVPAFLRTQWKVSYDQDRLTPTIQAGS